MPEEEYVYEFMFHCTCNFENPRTEKHSHLLIHEVMVFVTALTEHLGAADKISMNSEGGPIIAAEWDNGHRLEVRRMGMLVPLPNVN